MALLKFANYAQSTLASGITSGQTTALLVDGSTFPALGAGEYFYLTLIDYASWSTGVYPPAQREIVKVTARAGNLLTIVRGVDGTAGQQFAAGAIAECRLNALAMTDIMSGAVTTFTYPGTGAVARGYSAKVSDVISVKDFGALGDGVTDDTAAFNACATAAGLIAADMYVPPTTTGYLISGTVALPQYVGMYGAAAKIPVNNGFGTAGVNENRGSCLLLTGTVNPGVTCFGNNAIVGMRFFYPNQTDTNPPVVYPPTIQGLAGNGDVLIDRCVIYNGYRGLDFFRQHYRLTVKDCLIWCLNNGIEIDNAIDVDRLTNVHMWPVWSQDTAAGKSVAYSCANAMGIRLGRADDIKITGCFILYKKYCIETELTVNGTTYGTIANCGFETAVNCIRLDSFNAQNGIQIIGCKIANPTNPLIASGVGIMVTAAATTGPVNIIGNNFWGANMAQSIFFNAPASAVGLIQGNTFYSGVAAQGMVKLQNVANLTIVNNSFGPISAGGFHLDLNGFTGAVGVLFDANFCSGGATINNPGAKTVLRNVNYAFN